MLTKFLFGLLILQLVNVYLAAPVQQPQLQSRIQITYSILSESRSLSLADTKAAIRYAFDQWSSVSPLDFKELPPNPAQPADIQISFVTGDHGDAVPFVGDNDEIVAHASTDGTLHFNDQINFKKYLPGQNFDLAQRDITYYAMHEIGHVLGLGHARDYNAVMSPLYRPSVDTNGKYVNPKLTSSDITAIQAMYGARN